MNECQYAADVGMPEYKCANGCMYAKRDARALLEALNVHMEQMAPHQRERVGGRLLAKSAAAIKALQSERERAIEAAQAIDVRAAQAIETAVAQERERCAQLIQLLRECLKRIEEDWHLIASEHGGCVGGLDGDIERGDETLIPRVRSAIRVGLTSVPY